ncbi:hypothetical protein I5G63_gp056 [Mycobacterium phage Imvubu]|uniref:Uncharacterized protein n=1 Tax=Mycobacterium phage Imvubu TaxID=2686233 RepID=A0A6B9L7H4_9CAUD|nr:hypothetical protein I5G63_gp056 [Mycobacterium phage Imvubu]QHB37797.1 hypothetical protein PBI_IMVUBU_56 [Mycobacterium phage Imvubu]
MSRDGLDGNTMIVAGDLRPKDIGTIIRFRQWDSLRETATVITGELRQISANSVDVHVTYGIGAEREETLRHDQPVTLRPTEHYNDVATLALYDSEQTRQQSAK